MILVILGSQMFQFNRLLKEIDRLVEKGIINDTLFAQTGASTYVPQNYRFKAFLDRAEFDDYINKSDIIISHGGTGSIITSLKAGKKVIAVARLKKFDEVVDDHQLELIQKFSEMGLIIGLNDVSQLEYTMMNMSSTKNNSFVSNTTQIIDIIDNFIVRVEKQLIFRGKKLKV